MVYASAAAFAAALIFSLVATPSVRDFALRRRLVDAGGVRKVHLTAIPRVGGAAFVAVFYAVALGALWLDPQLRAFAWAARPRSFVFLAGGLAIAALGLCDDTSGLRARHKLAVQLLVAAALCWAGFAVHDVQLPNGAVLHLGLAGVPLTMLWIAGVMNAMNLIDGLDGLAGGIAEIALGAIFVIAAATANPLLGVYSAVLAGAVCGFLFYNFNPATIFMGDTGSLFLGYFLSVGLLVSSRHPGGSHAAELMVPLVALGVPLADTLLAIARRTLRGRALFSPDKGHIHHRLLARGYSQREAVLALYLVCAGLCAAALVMWFGGRRTDLAVTAGVLGASAGILYALGFFDRVGLRALGRGRRQNRSMHATIDAIAARLEHASALGEVLESIHDLQPAVAAARVKARIGSMSTEVGQLLPADHVVSMRFALCEGRHKLGHVELAWSDGRSEVDEDHALAIERLCDNVARAVRRVAPEQAVLTPVAVPRIDRRAS